MRLLGLMSALLIGSAISASAQAPHGGDAAVTYQWVHANTQPGACGCFDLNGGVVSASLGFSHQWAGVAEVSAGHEGGYKQQGASIASSLTLVSYLAGPRYNFGQSWTGNRHIPQPFAQVLVGAAHLGGGLAGAGDGTSAFAARAGGGLDLPIGHRFAIRLIQADYYLTDFANGADDHQNNFLLGAGAVFRWSR